MNNLEQIVCQYYKDKNGNPMSYHIRRRHQISPKNYQIQLDGIPDEYRGIEVIEPLGLYRVYNADEITEDSYWVRDDGNIFFHESRACQNVMLDYYSIGLPVVGAGRIYTLLDEEGNVIETLEDILKKGKTVIEALKTMNDVIVVINDLKTSIYEGIKVVNTLDATIDEGYKLLAKLNAVEYIQRPEFTKTISDIKVDINTCKEESIKRDDEIKKNIKQELTNIKKISEYNLYDYGYKDGQYINSAVDKIIAMGGNNIGIALPSGEVKINKPLILGREFYLKGNKTTILADYDNWSNEEDCTALKIIVNDGVDIEQYYDNFIKRFENFCIRGINASKKQETTGIEIKNILPGEVSSEFNRSLNNALLENIHIDNFENGLIIGECWNSNFNSITISRCKKNLQIVGQSVNNNFNGMQIVNPKSEFPDVNNLTFGILIDTKKQKECEGISFNSCTIYGCNYNIYLKNGYFINFDKVISDGAVVSALVNIGAKDVTLDKSYLCNIGGQGEDGKKCVIELFDSGRNSDVIIRNSKIISVGGCLYGIRFGNNFVNDRVTIDNNKFESFIYPLYSDYSAPNNSLFINNYFYNTGEQVVKIDRGLSNTLFDNNYANNDVYFFDFSKNPNVDASINIGKNKSLTHNTYYLSSKTIPSGITEMLLENNFYDSNKGLNTISKIYPPADFPTYKIVEDASWSKTQLKFNEPTKKTYNIRYESRVVKYNR